MLIDSHCHLDRLEGVPDALPDYLSRAADAGVDHLLCVSINLEAWPDMRALIEPHPRVSCSVGVHPCEDETAECSEAALIERAADPRVVAIGETGLDYYYGKSETERARQRERFALHVAAARTTGKPLIVHTRDAREDTIGLLRKTGADAVGGVLHCFTESWDMARQALDLGFYISFSGIVTFRNADSLRDVARRVPEDLILVETDAPYLAPVPHRGKPNEPAWVADVARCVAEVRGVPFEALAEQTSANYRALFQR
ncbi:TatD family hydrolase [Thiohalobacter sp.]|uniref:TatD family hydrolase n=1 Tax=Thiohalobacter sp. TaxID=2025948 RepID=UPI00262C988A|nr:TatD family hydrolase [Thiohalobacter sp.]